MRRQSLGRRGAVSGEAGLDNLPELILRQRAWNSDAADGSEEIIAASGALVTPSQKDIM